MLPIHYDLTEHSSESLALKEYLGSFLNQSDDLWPDDDEPCFSELPDPPPTQALIEKYGSLSKLGIERRDITDEELDAFNEKRILGLNKCDSFFHGYKPAALFMLLGGFAPIDVWVGAIIKARLFVGTQHIEGFSYSKDQFYDYAETVFYRNINSIHEESLNLEELGLIRIYEQQ